MCESELTVTETVMETLDRIEELFASLEEHVLASLSAVGLPSLHDVTDRLWIDISRYGPGLPAFPEVHIPSLGDFQIPPPPPPPPASPASQWLGISSNWIGKHPWKTLGIFMSVAGMAGYIVTQARLKTLYRLRRQQPKSSARRQVVGEAQCHLFLLHPCSSPRLSCSGC